MKRCKKCGKAMANRTVFCPVCGMKADGEEAAERRNASPIDGNGEAYKPRAKKKKKRLTMAGWGLVALVLAAVIFLILLLTGVIGGKPKLQAYTPPAQADQQSADAAASAQSGESGLIEMPTLTGLTEEEAQTKLAELGLVAQIADGGYDSAFADGVVLTQSLPAGDWANGGDTIALTVNRLPLTLQAIWMGPRNGRLLLGNLLDVCRGMDTTNPNFTYTVEILTNADPFILNGGFRCLTGPNEETPVSRLSAKFLKGKQNVGGIESNMAADDHIQWVFAIDDWTGFNDAYIEGYRVTLSSKANEEIKVEKRFSVDSVAGDMLMEQTFAGGSLRVEAPAKDQLVIRLTDDRLQDGYPCSSTKGSAVPLWDVKLFQASYKWLDVTVDGRNCPSLAAMNLNAAQLFEEKSGKSAAPGALSGVSYVTEGNTIILTVNLPAGSPHNPYELEWAEVTLGEGGDAIKMKLQ